MDLVGSKGDLFQDISGRLHELGISISALAKTRAQRAVDDLLADLTIAVRQGAQLKDAELSLFLERLCIDFELARYAATPEDIKRLNKQISESGAAKASLDLINTPARYRRHVKELFPNGINHIPEGEAYILHTRRQIIQLGQYQKGMATPAQKMFFVARQDNLRAGVAAFKKLQKEALFPTG
jgi:hypothetical protein